MKNKIFLFFSLLILGIFLVNFVSAGTCTINLPSECGVGLFNLCDRAECEDCDYTFVPGILGDNSGTCYPCANLNTWTKYPSECCGSLPIPCQGNRCVPSVAECGTCGCQQTSCSSDESCCQNQCGLNQFMELKCISGKCQEFCINGYTRCPNSEKCVINLHECFGNDCTLDSPEECGEGIGFCQEKECEDCGWNYVEKGILGVESYCIDTPVYDTCQSCDKFAWSTVLGSFIQSYKCEPKGWTLAFSWFFIRPPQGTTTCGLSLIKLILVPIVFIFSFLFLLDYIGRFKSLKGKNKKWYKILITLIIAGLISFLVYQVFILGLIIFVIIILIKMGVNKFL